MSTRPIDLDRLHTYSIDQRAHKVDSARLAGLPSKGSTFADWWSQLPPYLGASALRQAVDAIAAARRAERGVAWAIGAHVVKVGCGPIVADLIRRRLVTAVAMNGATAIHDYELAVFGATSEEVADTLRDGRFGMVRETADFFAQAVTRGAADERGLGAAAGRLLIEQQAPHRTASVLAAAAEADIPATVHVAYGTDTIHVHPQIDPRALGQAAAIDFRRVCAVVCGLGAAAPGAVGGVWCNIGSAVILPEVFLKAVAVARNLGHDLDAMTTVNLDMQPHYRPRQNVIGRPVQRGRGLEVIGHHELLLPLLRQALIEAM
jgi:hypothetical protein